MFEKRSAMELCSLISLLLVLFCIVNVRSVQLVKLSGGSGKSAWSKASSQPFRHIRGFRPESLSTARGFGKRAGVGLPLAAFAPGRAPADVCVDGEGGS